MKMIIDRDFTTLAKVQLVKDAIADFKTYFTEGDLLRIHNEQWEDEQAHGEILKCTVKAFAATDYSFDNRVCFRVEMILDGDTEFTKISYYFDKIEDTFKVSHDYDDILHTYEVYRMVI